MDSFGEHRSQAAAQRFAERRQREQEAPRLLSLIPTLNTLKLVVEERRGTWPSATPEGSHVRRVVVESAPALFMITCHDPECRDGGFELTSAIMRALRRLERQFEVEEQCPGHTGTADCQRVIRVLGAATYH